METTIVGYILRLYGDNGNEHDYYGFPKLQHCDFGAAVYDL